MTSVCTACLHDMTGCYSDVCEFTYSRVDVEMSQALVGHVVYSLV